MEGDVRVAENRISMVCAIVAFLLAAIPSSPVHAQTTHQDNWFLEDIRVPDNLAPGITDEPFVIAVVDDGMRITHRDLADFIWTNPLEIPDNRIDDDGNGYVDDVHGWDVSDENGDVGAPEGRADFYHGTHIAGVITNIARAAYGESAPRFIRIMPIKTLADSAPTTYLVDAYEGIEYAIRAGTDIIVTSWGVGQITSEESRILQEAADNGILVVASGGNLPEEREQYPAAHSTVLAVASTDPDGQKTLNSNYGQFIDISAPGVDIHSASVASDDSYAVRDGTSFSAAMVAAAAALIKLQHGFDSLKQIEACLESSAEPLEVPSFEYSAKLGSGKLNVEAAVTCDLLTGETGATNRLILPKGFLHGKTTTGPASITWAIEPEGRFKGIRFTPVFNGGEAA